MLIDTRTLLWLFPIVFMFHDFEELILFEPWLKKNAAEIRAKLAAFAPAFFLKQVDCILAKSSTAFAFPVSLIFALTCLATILAAVYGQYAAFLLASGVYFTHGFLHLGQAIALRRYVPALITSLVFVIPYGLVLYPRLIAAGIVDLPGLLAYFALGAALILPIILGLHAAGEYLYQKALGLLVGAAEGK